MEDLLLELKKFGAVGVKAEFEAEGATFGEIAALKALCDLDLTVKIGGCGALNDINMAYELGAKNIVAPMVETPYALEKFVETAHGGNLYINIETITGYNNFEKMCLNDINGVVFGRSDMAGSMGGIDVESPQMLEMAKTVAGLSRAQGKDFILGGGISLNSLDFLSALNPPKFETRKIIFDGTAGEKGILLALEFEILWLQTRQNKDVARISRLSEAIGQIHQK